MNELDHRDDRPLVAGPWREALRAELVTAGVRLQRKRRARQRLVGAGGAIAAGLLLVLVTTVVIPEPASAGPVRVERHGDGSVEVAVIDTSAAPEEIVAAIEEEGVPARLAERSTGPSKAGDFLRLGGTLGPSGIPPEERSDRLHLPPGFDGTILVLGGALAPPGERYDIVTDALDHGEPLDQLDRSALEAGRLGAPDTYRAALDAGLEVTVIDNATGEALTEPPPGSVVRQAVMMSDRNILLRIDV